MNIEEIRQQARDENTVPEILSQLAHSYDNLTRKYVAGNPNTDIETLEKLSEYFPEEVVANPIFNLLLLEDCNNYSKFVRLSLARNSTTSAKILAKLIVTEDFAVLLEVASNPNAAIATIEELFNFKTKKITSIKLRYHQKVRGSLIHCRLANNPSTPIYILEQLSKDFSEIVRCEVAKNINTPHNILEQLAKDFVEIVRYEVAKNINTPREILKQLTGDREIKIANLAINNLKTNQKN